MKISFKNLKKGLLALSCCSLFLLYSCGASKKTVKVSNAKVSNVKAVAADIPPQVDREFRAAWVASVANINWPSKPGLSTADQQKEAIVLLDFLKKNNFNAVIFQVRPQADAFYNSSLEPWSVFLTGRQGQAPNPYYDPLEFWIEAAHDRGLELHVWLNPYRAHHMTGKVISEQSIVKKRPDLVVKLKDGQYWMDPSNKGTQDHVSTVVQDIVKRYDIDGVHFDDYFYPYESYNGGADFPDDVSWNAYLKNGGELNRGDWRRQSVNQFIERLYKEIKAEKKYVKFGLSPFGIWKPGYPASIKGMDQYNKLYADAKLWLNKGWIDYFMPQLYWTINSPAQSFPVLLGWWETENTMKRHLWPGMNVALGGDDKNVDEIVNQIMLTRGMLPNSPGTAHWSIGGLTKHEKLIKGIAEGPYKKQALIPPTPWLGDTTPNVPVVRTELKQGEWKITWNHTNAKDVFKWIVYYKYGGTWSSVILNRNDRFLVKSAVENSNKLTNVAVTAVDRLGNESAKITILL